MLRVLWGGRRLCGPGRQWRSVALGMPLGWEAVGECCWSGGPGCCGAGRAGFTGLDAVGLAWAAFEDGAKYWKASWRSGAGCY